MGIFAIGIFPLKDYVLRGGWQNFYAWVPCCFHRRAIIGMITRLIRKIARAKGNTRILGWTFGSLWTVGWVCLIMLITSIMRDFRSSSRLEEEQISPVNPKADKMVVTSSLPFNKKILWP